MYFQNLKTIEEIKQVYRELMKQHHPDKGGDLETAQRINAEYDQSITRAMRGAFQQYSSEYKEKYNKEYSGDFDEFMFSDILKRVMEFNVTIEIIGYWVYVFDSYEVKDELKAMGFWWSGKHKAWVFSGSPKKKFRTKMSLDDIKEVYGAEELKRRAEREKISA
jgi:curved DNA-binding protein CbpA